MGKPAMTYFCEKGHIVADSMQHEFTEFEMYDKPCPPCPVCMSGNIEVVIEWGDPDYGDIDDLVPHEPVKHEDKQCVDHRGNKYFERVPVYDVSKLFSKCNECCSADT